MSSSDEYEDLDDNYNVSDGEESGRSEGEEEDQESEEGQQESDAEEMDERDDFSGSDAASENEENEGNEDLASKLSRNACWADAMAKVLHANKPKNSRTVILAKARKDADIIKARAAREAEANSTTFEVASQETGKPVAMSVDQIKQEDKKPVVSQAELDRRQKKRDWDLIGRIKPDIVLDREKERALSRLATKGVVTLFNAVRVQQKNITVELQRAGPLERKREKVLKSLDKKAFLNLLQGQAKGKAPVKTEAEVKDEPMDANDNSDDDNPTWSVLRDDFMNGGRPARLRDWNKESSDEGEGE